MTRRDRNTWFWLLPLAVFLCLWWRVVAHPCLMTDISNRWYEAFPPAPGELTRDYGNGIVIHNPYGLEACDHWGSTEHDIIWLVSLMTFMALLGLLSVRRFDEKPIRRAGLLVLIPQAALGALVFFIYWPRLERAAGGYEEPLIWIEAGFSVFVVLLSATLAMLAALITTRLRRAVTKA